MRLSILIPVHNERYLIAELLRRVRGAALPENVAREVIVVDDGSTDGTAEAIASFAADSPGSCPLTLLRNDRRRGKGFAVRRALAAATGELCVVQDADLEYDPADLSRVIEPLLAGAADAVYGSRFLASGRRRALYFWHSVGNRLLTLTANAAANIALTDLTTCYKAFRTELLRTLPLRCDGFAFDTEVTIKAAKRGFRIYEVPVSYDGRTYLEGKKTHWRDGIRSLLTTARFTLLDDLYDDRSGHDILASLSRAHRFNLWMADTLRPYLGHRVLEVGAGIGNLTIEFLPRDSYVASDLDPLHLGVLQSMALRRPGLRVHKLDATDPGDYAGLPAATDPAALDTAVALNVIEHIPDAAAAMRNLFVLLSPGGRVIVLVPQGPWLYCDLDRELEHVKRYTAADARVLLETAGFEVETTFDFNRMGVIGWLLNGKLLGRTRIAKFQLKAFDAGVWLWRRIDWLLPWHGLSVVAIGRKLGGAGTNIAVVGSKALA